VNANHRRHRRGDIIVSPTGCLVIVAVLLAVVVLCAATS
jgi:hypothetical protein